MVGRVCLSQKIKYKLIDLPTKGGFFDGFKMIEAPFFRDRLESNTNSVKELETDDWKRIIVVVAHPDDAEMAMGGTIAKLVNEEREIILVVVTDGERGQNERIQNYPLEKLAKKRREEQIEAAKILGVSGVIFLGLPDKGLTLEKRELSEKLRIIFEEYNPNAVFTWDCLSPHFKLNGHPHPDHEAIDFATYEALKKARLNKKPELFLFLPQQGQISHYCNLDGLLKRKIEALSKHLTQVDPVMLASPAQLAFEVQTRTGHFAEGFRRMNF